MGAAHTEAATGTLNTHTYVYIYIYTDTGHAQAHRELNPKIEIVFQTGSVVQVLLKYSGDLGFTVYSFLTFRALLIFSLIANGSQLRMAARACFLQPQCA